MKIGRVAANLPSGEAEELRKAMGGKRSEPIIAGLTTRLHEGMTANGFDAATQEEAMRVLATVKECMFPESRGHSLASIAYPEHLLVRDGEKEILLPVERLDWVEAAEYYCCLHVENEGTCCVRRFRTWTSVSTRGSFCVSTDRLS